MGKFRILPSMPIGRKNVLCDEDLKNTDEKKCGTTISLQNTSSELFEKLFNLTRFVYLEKIVLRDTFRDADHLTQLFCTLGRNQKIRKELELDVRNNSFDENSADELNKLISRNLFKRLELPPIKDPHCCEDILREIEICGGKLEILNIGGSVLTEMSINCLENLIVKRIVGDQLLLRNCYGSRQALTKEDRDRLEKAEQSTRRMWKKLLNIYWFNIVEHADMISEDSDENMVAEASPREKIPFIGKAIPKAVQLWLRENYPSIYDSLSEKIKPKKTLHKKAPKVKKSANKLSNEDHRAQSYANKKSKTRKYENHSDSVYYHRPTSPVQAEVKPKKSPTPENSFPDNEESKSYADRESKTKKYENLSDSAYSNRPASPVQADVIPTKSFTSEKGFLENRPTQSYANDEKKSAIYENRSVSDNRSVNPTPALYVPTEETSQKPSMSSHSSEKDFQGQASTLTENNALPYHKNHLISHYPPPPYFSETVQGPPPMPTTRNTDQSEQKWDESLQSDAYDTSRSQASLSSSLPQTSTSPHSFFTDRKKQTSDFRTYNFTPYKASEINRDSAIGSTRRGQSNVRFQLNKPSIPPKKFSYVHGQEQTPNTRETGHNEQHLRYNTIPRISERPARPPMPRTIHGYAIAPIQVSVNVINNSPDQRETFTQSNFQRSANETDKYQTMAPPKRTASPDKPKPGIKVSSEQLQTQRRNLLRQDREKSEQTSGKVDQTKPPTQNQVQRSSSVRLRSRADVSLDSNEEAILTNQIQQIKPRRVPRRPQTQIITAAQAERLEELRSMENRQRFAKLFNRFESNHENK